MSCDFIVQLSKLRKQSAESVDNTDSFDDYKKYIHVERRIEKELRVLLRQINSINQKCLLLLCGSAGDGKSHLISFLKNQDEEGLLSDFITYNDATESDEPTRTSVDTLAEVLCSFSDQNLKNDDKTKLIIAINLGTLNKFLDSSYGSEFLELKQYIEENGVFSISGNKNIYKSGSVFQHVSFADYQIFSLSSNGINTEYVNSLIKKVFNSSEGNPFYNSFNNCEQCPLHKRCPVVHNYLLLSDSIVQTTLVERILEIVVKEKVIVTTRDVLNLLFDIIVHPEFSYSKLNQVLADDTQFLTDYISYTTPMLLNEYKDISPLLNAIQKHDVLKERVDKLDSDITKFHVAEKIKDDFSIATNNTPYSVMQELTSIDVLGATKPDLKKQVYRFMVRLQALKGVRPSNLKYERLYEFVNYIYLQSTNQTNKLQGLYDATKKALLNWDGYFGSDYLCLSSDNDCYWLLEHVSLKPDIKKSAPVEDCAIESFPLTIEVRFKNEYDSNMSASLQMDYSLYDLIIDMREGYRPTVRDKNHHANFVSFVHKCIDFGNKDTQITIVPKDESLKYKMVFEEDDFGGFTFKVVK